MGKQARRAALGIGLVLLLAPAGCSHPRLDATREAPPLAAGSAPSSLPAPAPPPPPRLFTVAASGDVLVHEKVARRGRENGNASGGYDFRPMMAHVRPILSGADLAICHLETPLSPDGKRLSFYPTFSVPPEIADALAETGYDACTTASNHSFDKGVAGVAATLAVLDVKGIPHAGTARSQAEAELTTFLLARGVKVALLSYAYGLNGFQLPEGQTWLVNLIDPGRILADAEAARARGAEFVVVSLHWGAEYRVPPTQAQRDLTGTLLASPAIDLILGHHAHVVQPIERIGSKYVVYGMGNFLSGQSGRAAATQSGIIARLLVEETDAGFQVRRLAYTPTWVEPGTFRVLPVAAALDAPGLGAARRAELAASWRRTVTAIASLGELGVVPAELPAAVP